MYFLFTKTYVIFSIFCLFVLRNNFLSWNKWRNVTGFPDYIFDNYDNKYEERYKKYKPYWKKNGRRRARRRKGRNRVHDFLANILTLNLILIQKFLSKKKNLGNLLDYMFWRPTIQSDVTAKNYWCIWVIATYTIITPIVYGGYVSLPCRSL